MKRTRFLLMILPALAALYCNAQSLKKYPVSNSGCSLYAYCPIRFEEAYSTDSSKVYTGECTSNDVTFGIICIRLLQPVDDPDKAEELMISYTDFLKTTFSVTRATGYGKGHRLQQDERTRGILDYWEDSEGDKWKVKSWTDGRYIGFMYAYSKKELPEQKVTVFLDGFRLPGM